MDQPHSDSTELTVGNRSNPYRDWSKSLFTFGKFSTGNSLRENTEKNQAYHMVRNRGIALTFCSHE